VGTEPSARGILNPESVAVTHCVALVPQRLFWTT
jgi:hypothetical protein